MIVLCRLISMWLLLLASFNVFQRCKHHSPFYFTLKLAQWRLKERIFRHLQPTFDRLMIENDILESFQYPKTFNDGSKICLQVAIDTDNRFSWRNVVDIIMAIQEQVNIDTLSLSLSLWSTHPLIEMISSTSHATQFAILWITIPQHGNHKM